ncbi:MAG: MarR family transcriptional regulator [Anaerolineaceae bacterium]|nr:MarR family transcriptional regulator [Anaerolineaceae bacterium]
MALKDKEYLQINQALFSLTNAYGTRLDREEKENPTDLLVSDRSVLMVLGQVGPIKSQQLSQIMEINPGTISVYVQRLVEKGLIEKIQDKNDRRNWLLHLTENGITHYQETIKGAVIYTQDFLSTLSDEEQIILHKLLLKASHSLGFDWQ